MLACVPLTTLNFFLSPNPTHASGSLTILQRVSDRLAARHEVYVMCPSILRCVMLAGYACMCPSDQLALFSFDNLTHASGSILILQEVSGWLAARHVVLVMCPRCPD
jgi:hypothetical protein